MSEAHEIDQTENRDYDAEARLMGWHPLEEFRGKQEDWVDARTFITRGEQQLPILRENNRKLQARVRRTDDELADIRTRFEALQGSIDTLRKMAETANEAGYSRAMADLKRQQREAVAAGDVQTFERIEGEINAIEETHDEVRAARAAPPETPAAQPKKPQIPGTPEFQAWFGENESWLRADPVLKQAAEAASRQLDESDDPIPQSEYWEKVTEMVQAKYPRRFAAATGQEFTPSPVPPAQDGETRRAAPVLAPRAGAPSLHRKTGIDSITDPDERKAARVAFNRVRASIPDYTEAEYMKVYVNPSASVIGDSISRKAKANGQARA